jgi:DNA gyrase/topoisomerase IV subunit B
VNAWIGVGLLVATFLGGWQVATWRADSIQAAADRQRAQDAQKAVRVADRAAEAFEASQQAAKARGAVINRRVLDEVQKPDARAACLSDDGLRILSDLAAGSNAGRQLAPAVRPTSGAE